MSFVQKRQTFLLRIHVWVNSTTEQHRDVTSCSGGMDSHFHVIAQVIRGGRPKGNKSTHGDCYFVIILVFLLVKKGYCLVSARSRRPSAIRLAERRYQAVSLFYKEDNEFIISFFKLTIRFIKTVYATLLKRVTSITHLHFFNSPSW